MNYSRIYNQLIDRARSRMPDGYVERHHVVPRCMGGADDSRNLVELYPEEHFTAHVLLVRIYPENRDLILAVHRMTTGHHGQRSRRKLYGWLRRRFAQRMSENSLGKGNSQFGTVWITDGKQNKKLDKNLEIPAGWEKGRILKEKVLKECIDCSATIKKDSLRCRKCAGLLKTICQQKVTDEELLEAMNDCDMTRRGSIAEILKKVGVVPQSAEYYKRIRALVVKVR